MPDKTSKTVLLASNVRLTGKYGKYSRIIKLAELFELMGMHVNIMVSELTFEIEKQHFSIIVTKANLKDTTSCKLLTKMVYNVKRAVILSSVYLKLLFCGTRYVIIASNYSGPSIDPLLACLLGKCMKVPFIFDYDDPDPENAALSMGWGKWNPYVILRFQLERVLCNSSRLTLVVGEQMRRLVSRSVNPRKVVVLYNTVSVSDFTQHYVGDSRLELDLPRDKTIISYVGLVKPKVLGIEDFLVAFSRVDADVREKFLILLVGPLHEYIYNMIRQLGLQNNVWSLGPLERQKALLVLRMSSLSIIPCPPSPLSKVIAPTKLFEAMSLGLPVLAPKVGELPLILGEEYPYYYEHAPNVLACVLRSVLNDERGLKVTGEKLRQLFAQKYSWECHKEQLLHVVSDFLSERCS
jgi:glycosyltransferase involved in cell wall biosynthesis